jgi:uncharacterized RDD family membrane protein YckC
MLRSRIALVLATWFGGFAVVVTARQAAPPFDVLLRNGRVVDGTGAPWYRADVAIKGDRIAAIGSLAAATAATTIDASNLVIAPGFIDMLGQSEINLLIDPRGASKLLQGVTSELTGEGSSAGPINDRMIADDDTLYERYHLTVDWRTFGDYLARLNDRAHPAINLGSFVGAGGVRNLVIGRADRPATPAELDTMKGEVARAMREGAFGLSSSLQYVPDRFATTAELTIATPEGVLFRLPLAGPASRLYAMLLDIAIVLGTVNGVGLLVYWIFAKAPGFGVMLITLGEFAIGFAYGALLEGFWNGQTIGKRLFHLRVIDHAGLPLQIEQAWVRNLMRVFDVPPLSYLVGGLSVLSSPLMQRFGDRVAGTLVVRQTPLAAPVEEFWVRQKYNSFMDYPAIAMKLRRAATPELATLIQDALRRRNELAAYARREIYRELAMYLQTEISPFPDELVERLSDEQYLINASGILFGNQRSSRIQV